MERVLKTDEKILNCPAFRKCVCAFVSLHLMMCAGVFLYFNVLVTAFNATDELIEVVINYISFICAGIIINILLRIIN